MIGTITKQNYRGNYNSCRRGNYGNNSRGGYGGNSHGNYVTNNQENWRNKTYQTFGNNYNPYNNFRNRGSYNGGRGQYSGRGNHQNKYPQNSNQMDPEVCYYHKRFGTEAFKCEGNCPMNQQMPKN